MSEFEVRSVPTARPIAPYVGGKKQLAVRLASMIEATPHSLYGEVFAGMAGVFFQRRTAPTVEVLNDISRDVATFFRVLQNHEQALMDMLRWQLTSRAEFERLNAQDPDRLTDLQRAARFLYIQRTAFGGKVAGRSFGATMTAGARFDVAKLLPLLLAAHERLSGVTIECLPWGEFLSRWDRPGALFFLDPPYFGTEHFYGRGLFAVEEYEDLAGRLDVLEGSFILTVNDVPEMREVFGRFSLQTAKVTYFAGGGEHVVRRGELIVSRCHQESAPTLLL